MQAKKIVLPDATGIADGTKTAILTVATPSDQYRVNSEWRHVGEEHWQHGMEVEAVSHFQRHESAVGDLLDITLLGTMKSAGIVRILSIMMVNIGDMTLDEIQALGYASRHEYNQQRGDILKRRGWYMTIERVP